MNRHDSAKPDCRRLLPWVGLLLVAPLGCVLETGVGDPQASRVDQSFLGHWISRENGQLLTIVQWDESTCLVDWMAYSGDESSPQPKLRALNKAWLTTIDDATYVTLKMLVPETGRQQKYTVQQLTTNGDIVTARLLNQKFAPFRDASTPKELERAIRQHHDDPQAFSDETVYRRTTAGESKPIRKAFQSGNG